MVLELHQGTAENTALIKKLLENLHDRGVDFEVARLCAPWAKVKLQLAARKLVWPVCCWRCMNVPAEMDHPDFLIRTSSAGSARQLRPVMAADFERMVEDRVWQARSAR